MIAILIGSNVMFLLAGIVLGRRPHARRSFNAGVAAGRASECQVHGWVRDPSLADPKRPRWPVLNRKPPDAPFVAVAAADPTPRIVADL